MLETLHSSNFRLRLLKGADGIFLTGGDQAVCEVCVCVCGRGVGLVDLRGVPEV